MLKPLTLLSIFLYSVFSASAQDSLATYWQQLPEPTGWVNDFEDLFTPEQESTLDSLLADYEQQTTREMVVVTIPTYATSIERFDALALFILKDWDIGKPEMDNGMVIAISKGHGSMRIEYGGGISMLMTNEQTKQIIDENIIPQFKEGDFYTGVVDGIEAIKQLLPDE